MANPVLRGTVLFQDRASAVLNRIRASSDLLNNSMIRSQQIAATGMNQIRRTTTAVGSYNRGLKETAERTQAATRHTRDMHITLTVMLKVMAMFAINLQIIRAATSPFTFLSGAIRQSADFQEEMQGINALLRLGNDDLKILGLGIRTVASDFGIATEDVLASAKQIASSISALNLGPLSEAEGVMNLVRAASRGAVIDNSSLADSVDALKSVMAGLNFEISMSEKVMARLFALVDVGDISFSELGQNIGDFIGTLAAIAPSDPLRRLAFTEDIFAIFAQLTNVQPVAEASTAVNRFLISVIKEAKGTEKIRQELERVTGIPLGLNILAEKGPLQFLNNIIEAIGRESPLVKEFIEGQREVLEGIEPISAQEFERITLSSKLASKLFPNVRALRPFLILAQAGGEQVNRIYADLIEAVGKFDEAQAEAMNNLNRQVGRLRGLWDSFRVILADPIVREATSFINDIADSISRVVNAAGFEQLSTGDKISNTLDALMTQLNTWWDTGGRDQVRTFADTFTLSLVVFLNEAVVSNFDKFVDIGSTIASAIVKGMIKFAADPSNLGNPVVLGAALNFAAPNITGGGLKGAGRGIVGVASLQNLLGGVEASPSGLLETGLNLWLLKSLLPGGRLGTSAIQAANVGQTLSKTAREALLAKNTTLPRVGGMTGRLGRMAALASGLFAGGIAGSRLPGLARTSGIAIGATLHKALPALFASNLILSGVGPLPDLGGITGLFSSAITGNRVEDKQSFDIGELFTAVGGAAVGGAAVGATAGLFGGLLAPVTSTAGAIGGGLIAGIVGGAINLRSQIFGGGGDSSPASTFSGLGIQERAIMSAFGVTNYPPGIIQPMLQNALAAGITNPNDLMSYIAFNLAVIQEESGFRSGEVVSDPTSRDPSARSGGLYQLNTAPGTGQGAGMSVSQLTNPITNTRVGSRRIADLFSQYGGNFFDLAQQSGHPGVSAKAGPVDFADRISRTAEEFLSNANNSVVFQTIATGGISGSGAAGGISVTVDGDLVITGVQNPEELAEQLANELFEAGAGAE